MGKLVASSRSKSLRSLLAQAHTVTYVIPHCTGTYLVYSAVAAYSDWLDKHTASLWADTLSLTGYCISVEYSQQAWQVRSAFPAISQFPTPSNHLHWKVPKNVIISSETAVMDYPLLRLARCNMIIAQLGPHFKSSALHSESRLYALLCWLQGWPLPAKPPER